MRAASVLLLLVLGLAGCDLSPQCPTCGDPPGEPGDEIVAGVNLTQLFQLPFSHERSAVMEEWAERATLPTPEQYVVVDSVDAPDGALWKVYEAVDEESGEVVHYGLVRIPILGTGEVCQCPVLVVAPEVGRTPSDVEDLPDVSSLPLESSLVDNLVIGWLVYREQALRVGGTERIIESAVAPFDVDAEDAVSFSRAITDHEILATDERGILGHGRGGTAALLASIRFPDAFDLWVDIAGPTDFFQPSFRDLVRFSLEDGADRVEFPAFTWFEEQIIVPLREGEMSFDEARHQLLLRSPAAFLEPVEWLFVPHGELDLVVHRDHTEAIAGTVRIPEPSDYLFVDASHERILMNEQVRSEVSRRIRERLVFNN